MIFLKKIHILIIFSFLVFYSCEKDINVELPPSEDKIVIEGGIETNQYPYVIITRNQGYFDAVDTNTLKDMVVTDAIVTVSSDGIVDTLHLSLDLNILPPIKYIGSKIKGESGKDYHLKVVINDKNYEADTHIPDIVPIDSLKFRYNTPEDTFGVIIAYWQDPPQLGNYYRIFTKTKNKDSVFIHRRFSLVDDQILNGQKIEAMVVRGKNPAVPDDNNDDGNNNSNEPPYWSFLPGETVYVKLQSMDKISFDFWKLIEQQASSNGNPFAAPTTLKTNISNNALGIWAGYAVDIDTITITPDVIIE